VLELCEFHTTSCLRFLPLLNPLIQGLENSRIHRSDDIHRRVQFFLRHPCFPCVRKASFYSRVAQSHHRNGQADEHLFTVGQTFDAVSVTVEGAKISSLAGHLVSPIRLTCFDKLSMTGKYEHSQALPPFVLSFVEG
jgi:hypothetical protein